jgi:hypothetical protein
MTELLNKVVINKDDCDNVRNYAKYFEIDFPDSLEQSLVTFESDMTYENQQQVKLEICKWLVTSTHDSFKDKLWEHPKKAAQEFLDSVKSA